MGTDDLFKRRKARKSEATAREKELRESYDKVLIVCEGEKTEPIYLEALRKFFDLSQTNIVIDPDSDSSPTSVVKYARKQIAKEREVPYDRVFCVIDRDRHADFVDAMNLIEGYRSRQTQLEAIVSHPCFEYWLLLHFEYTTMVFGVSGGSPCDDLIAKKLKIYIPNYAKADYESIETLVNQVQIDQAVSFAQRANEAAKREKRVSPATQMPILVEYLKNLKN